MNTIEERVSVLLKDLGIPASLSGYKYIKYAVEISVKCPSILDAVCKQLYPAIASHFHSKSSRVERCIRHAIESRWMQGNCDTQKMLFGYSINNDKGNPTNSEFLATVVDYILMHIAAEAQS